MRTLTAFQKLTILFMIAVIAASMGVRIYYENLDRNVENNSMVVERKQERLTRIHVSGDVAAPGMYTLKSGSSEQDAIDAAGGLKAASEGINEATDTVGDFQTSPAERNVKKIVVTNKSSKNNYPEAPKKDMAALKGHKININTASGEDLMKLPGIGPAMSRRVVEFRNTNGSFQTIEDIMQVKGIGDKKFEKMKDFIKVR